MIKKSAFSFLPGPVRRWLGVAVSPQASTEIEVVDGEVSQTLLHGWQDAAVATRQQAAFRSVLERLRSGSPREDFLALARAVNQTQLDNPLLIEVGCGSGWKNEVLRLLTKRPFHYVGVDYSSAMIELGRRDYPSAHFITGDATALPFRDEACDILVSGTVLMHLLHYRRAITESRRVTRRWCIFHMVPVLQHRATTLLAKKAYGADTIEVIFNESELLAVFAQSNLELRGKFDSIPYNLKFILGESTSTRTYLCEATS